MRRAAFTLAILLLARGAGATQISFGKFGSVEVYRPAGTPRSVALFVSGDGGWNQGVVSMAEALEREQQALVLGVDIRHYLRQVDRAGGCASFAIDFEALSQYAQKVLDLPAYTRPVLVGYSSGATLVYAALAQAPPNTFAGALSLGFCPDLQIAKPVCAGAGGLTSTKLPKGRGIVFDAVPRLPEPWFVLQGGIDQVCDSGATGDYVGRVGRGTLVALPKVGHGFSVEKNWMPQFRSAYSSLVTPPASSPLPVQADLGGLPVVEVPARGAAQSPAFAVILSGDGGWAGIDRSLGDALAAQGIPVAGLDSLRYFWRKRSPDELARDVAKIAEHYAAAWKRQELLLIGYSRGADVLPFAARRLPAALRERVRIVALLGPGLEASFEFHVSDWLGGASEGTPILPELAALRGTRVLCVSGSDEKESLCRGLDPALADVMMLSGGHHFGGDYGAIATKILQEAKVR